MERTVSKCLPKNGNIIFLKEFTFKIGLIKNVSTIVMVKLLENIWL